MRDYCCYQITMVCVKKHRAGAFFFFDTTVRSPAATIILEVEVLLETQQHKNDHRNGAPRTSVHAK